MKIFVDTSAWYAVLVKSDTNHQRAAKYFSQELEAKKYFVTTNFILDETITRLRYDVSPEKAVEFYRLAMKAEKENTLRIVTIDYDVQEKAIEVLAKYRDHRFSFTDCTSFIVARKEKADNIFAFDEDFRVMGFNVQP